LSSRARFGVRTGSTRRGGRGEPTQGLREMARVTAAAPRRPWRAAQGRRAAMGATARFVRNKREDEVPHLAAMLRVKQTEAGRQWWRRSTSATGGRRRRRQAPVRQRRRSSGAPGPRAGGVRDEENEEALRECFTGDVAPGRPAMARRRDPLGGGTLTKVGMDEGLGRGKRVPQGLSRDL
jgi:hypothetical protein